MAVTHSKLYDIETNPSAEGKIDDITYIDMFPFKLKGRDRFYQRDHPENLHPESLAYSEYWRNFAKNCIEGKWIQDEVGTWVYMFPKLYYYINYVVILNKERKRIHPDLCDLEWIIFTYIFCMDGFSGFEDDDKYTCNRLVERYKLSKDKKLTDKQRKKYELNDIEFNSIPESCFNEDGNLKKFIDPWVYLTRTYLIDDKRGPLGHPLYNNKRQNALIMGGRGLRKDLEETTPVFTENGPVPIKDIVVGDKVYDHTGNLTNVMDKVSFNNQMQYEISFADGRKVTCGSGHLWEIFSSGWTGGKIMPTKEIIKSYKGHKRKEGSTKSIAGKRDPKYFVRLTEAVQYPEKDLPIDPYFLGLWLGGGSKHRVSITTMDNEIRDYIYYIADKYNLKVTKHYKPDNKATDYHITHGISNGRTNELLGKFKSLNLINNKHIPDEYLFGSEHQRMELVRGLMDSDGGIGNNGGIAITLKDEHIIDSLREVLHSLGIKNNKKQKVLRYFQKRKLETPWVYYTLTILTGKEIFKLPRKIERLVVNPKSKPSITRRTKNAIIDVKEVGVKPSHCLMVDNEDRLFLCADYVVTHNSFSLYMGDYMHEWTFGGIRRIEDISNAKNPLLFAMGSGSSDQMQRTVNNVVGFYDNQPGKYSFDDPDTPDFMGPFYKNYQGSLKVGKQFQHVIKGKGNVVELFGSTVQISAIRPDRTKIVAGDRFRRVYIEECGFISYLKDVFSSNIDSLAVEGDVVGSWIATGTSGDLEDVRDSKAMFENPKPFNITAIPNYWKNTNKSLGLFLPSQYSKRNLSDKDGFIYLDLATSEIAKERQVWAEELDSVSAGSRIMYNPVHPDEMLVPNEQSILPKKEAQFRLTEIESYDINKAIMNIGTLFFDTTYPHGVRFDKDLKDKLVPLTKYTDDTSNISKEGAFVMYEPPPSKRVPKHMYWVIYDPAAQSGEGKSNHSIIVYKHFLSQDGQNLKDTVVAEWIGRHLTLEQNYQQVIKVANYYNAMIFPETNVGGFVEWALKNKWGHKLQRDSYELQKEISPGAKRSHYKFGFRMGGREKWWALQRYSSWLMEPKTYTTLDDGTEVPDKRNIDFIYSTRVLDEIINYNTTDNFDHTSSMLGLMLLLNQLDNYKPSSEKEEEEAYNQIKPPRRRSRKKRSSFEDY